MQRSQSQNEINLKHTNASNLSSTSTLTRLDDSFEAGQSIPINPLLTDQQLRLQHQLLQLKHQQQLQQQMLFQQFQQQQQQLLDAHEKQLQDQIRTYLVHESVSNLTSGSASNSQSNLVASSSQSMTVDEHLRNSSSEVNCISSRSNASFGSLSGSSAIGSGGTNLPAPSIVPKSKEASGIASSAVRQRLQEFVLNKKQRELRQIALAANSGTTSSSTANIGVAQQHGIQRNASTANWNPALHKFDDELMPLRKTGTQPTIFP